MHDTTGTSIFVERRLLQHPTRRRLYHHLLVLPGDHFRSIVRALTIGVGTARHHLDILVQSGLLYERRSAGRCRYYVAGDENQRDRNELFGKHWDFRALRLRAWTVLRRIDGASATQVAKALGISRQLAAYHLSRLESDGFARRQDGRYRVAATSRAVADLTSDAARNS